MSDDASSAGDAEVATATTVDACGVPANPNDATRSSDPGDKAQPRAVASDDRLPAPLQFRDPDRYTILGEHGRGGLGRVLRAHDRELGREIAVKELLNRGNASELRFFREALITARLEHPGIVPVHEAGRWPDGRPFYAMKLVQGRPLRELIAECTALDDRLALLPHVIAVADAIAYAHDRKIIHRDLKPSNVIVGAFGETVVIDWGLAKDLTAEIADPVDDGPFRTPPSDALTAAGSVLGTPAYMAPEQSEGKADERADIYALGAMIVHVVTGHAPARRGDRGSPIDMADMRHVPRDLVAIVAHATKDSPDDRYGSAKDLADDLRRYVQHRPVSARRYSLAGRAILGYARHRVASTILIVAMTALVAVLLVENHRVEGQRERAVASESVAEKAQRDAETALGQLTLRHVESLLSTDPSAALDELAQYRGDDVSRARVLRAQAVGRGVAFLRATPHTDSIYWIKNLPDGSVVTLANDGLIVRTARDGRPTVLSNRVAPVTQYAYSPTRHLVAYVCEPSKICATDVLADSPNTRVLGVPAGRPDAIAFSPDDSLIALLSDRASISVLSVADLASPREVFHATTTSGLDLGFVDSTHIALETETGIDLISIDRSVPAVSFDGARRWDALPALHQLAVGTRAGDAIVVDSTNGSVESRHTVCQGSVNALRLLPGRALVGYACANGTIGIWDFRRDTTRTEAQLDGSADVAAVSDAGDYFVVGSDSGTVVVADLATGLTSEYIGHGIKLTAVAAPTPDAPVISSGDTRGMLRVWPLPRRLARVSARVETPTVGITFDADSSVAIASGPSTSLVAVPSHGEARTIGPHDPSGIFVIPSWDRQRFATFGRGPLVEVWRTTPLVREFSVDTGGATVAQAWILDGAGPLITAGRDGRLLLWTSLHNFRELANLGHPIVRFVVIPNTTVAVVQTDDDVLWRVDLDGKVEKLSAQPHSVTMLQVARAGRWIGLGDEKGVVSMIDTSSWRQIVVLREQGAVRHITFTPDADAAAVATEDGMIAVGRRHGEIWDDQATWSTFDARGGYLRMTRDGLLIAACSDGAIWIYSAPQQAWLYIPTGKVTLNSAALSLDERRLAVVDTAGRILIVDIGAARDALVRQPDVEANETKGSRL